MKIPDQGIHRQSYVNKALHKPRLTQGVTTAVLAVCYAPAGILALGVAAAFGLIPAIIPLFIGASAHMVLRYFFRNDHRCMEIYGRYSQLADHYHPHKREKLNAPFERPARVGRGLRL